MPSGSVNVAPVGHTDWHGASSQCMHWVGTVSTLTQGCAPRSNSWNLISETSAGKWFWF